MLPRYGSQLDGWMRRTPGRVHVPLIWVARYRRRGRVCVCVRRIRFCMRPTSEDRCGKSYSRLASDRPGAQENERVGGCSNGRALSAHASWDSMLRMVDSPIPSKQSNLSLRTFFFFLCSPALSPGTSLPSPLISFLLVCVSPIPSSAPINRQTGL